MARDASPISLVGVVTLRLSHVVSTKGQKGLKRLKGTLSPGLSGYAPRLFISLRFHVLRTTMPIRFGTLSPGGIGLCSQSSAIYALSSPSDVAVDTWINHVKSSHNANICRCVYYKQSETLIVCEKMFNFAKMFFAI